MAKTITIIFLISMGVIAYHAIDAEIVSRKVNKQIKRVREQLYKNEES